MSVPAEKPLKEICCSVLNAGKAFWNCRGKPRPLNQGQRAKDLALPHPSNNTGNASVGRRYWQDRKCAWNVEGLSGIRDIKNQKGDDGMSVRKNV